ncbi:DUF3872 domain-containing protein [Sphingobacterium detergens]|uniref:Uncharacterized protein DUF3872 n=1 Tax=Sphingobacterium detergens TaxID=1145106 RepID=A0A420B6R7_SPHD1|nr:DUF3872 domain-containing protein [Sphingobacterium detergens]RKE52444.1 uncharacterized protein DUF3872 [Sphingobacterium detergens]
MKRLINKSKFLCLLVLALAGVAMLWSCNKDKLEIQQNYPFEVKVMPVPGEVVSGQTVEIRIAIQPSGNYKDAKYFIRYFQFDGRGSLRYYSEPPYLPNDLYHLPQTQFRLYYTSQSSVSQSFDIWVSDNFGNEQQVSFQFNSSD